MWGGFAGAFGETLMHPVDTLKTRIQSGGQFIVAHQVSIEKFGGLIMMSFFVASASNCS